MKQLLTFINRSSHPATTQRYSLAVSEAAEAHKVSRAGGFTLIELLIASALISIMAIGTVNLFIGIDTLQRRAQRIEIATRVAEAKIESLRNSHYNSLEPDTTVDFSAELPEELPPPRSGEVVITEPTPGLKQIEVSVTYAQLPRAKTVTLTGLIGSIGIAQ
ncbi:MAG: type II secretion system protein [Candidatus Saccharimonadales bacterium]